MVLFMWKQGNFHKHGRHWCPFLHAAVWFSWKFRVNNGPEIFVRLHLLDGLSRNRYGLHYCKSCVTWYKTFCIQYLSHALHAHAFQRFQLSFSSQQPHAPPTTSPSSVHRASTSPPLRAQLLSGQVLFFLSFLFLVILHGIISKFRMKYCSCTVFTEGLFSLTWTFWFFLGWHLFIKSRKEIPVIVKWLVLSPCTHLSLHSEY